MAIGTAGSYSPSDLQDVNKTKVSRTAELSCGNYAQFNRNFEQFYSRLA